MSVALVIACKGFHRAKTRLAPALEPGARAALAARMLRHVLATARAADLPAWVLTGDPVVADLARRQGAAVLSDPGQGHNAALGQACAGLAPQARLIVLPADLPALTPAALARLAAPRPGLTLAPDRHLTGTNALALDPSARPGFAFRFGPDSLRLHRAEARQRGLPARILHDPGLALDIDTPADLALWPPAAPCPAQPTRSTHEPA